MGFFLLSAITFLSAFLLFQIELIMAKLFLPNYGGSYLVWGACVVFFQGVLLLGYLFAHQWITRKNINKYIRIHLVLLLIPFLFFPGRMIQISQETPHLLLVVDIFLKLFLSIGPVFFVLSTISLVTQSWLSNSQLSQKHNPYALYAVSNLGSFAGLLSYPFIFELFLTNTQQLNVWRISYVFLVLLNIVAFKIIKFSPVEVLKDEKSQFNFPLDMRSRILSWFCFSAAGVILFLSVTNIITYEIAPVPLLWIIPLSIYLLSFVLCFKNKPFVPSWIQKYIFLIVAISIVYYFCSKMYVVLAIASIIVFSLLLFFLCMYLQGQLIRSKPQKEYLTLFYVIISLGGFLGGLLTSWVVPLVSDNLVEFLIGLLLLAVGARQRILMIITALAILFASPIDNLIKQHVSILKKRNYYGIYDVFESRGLRLMLHGTTLHGVQFADPKQHWIPLGYYSPTSPLGDILTKNIFNVKRIAGIGLGTGTVAMYTRGDCPIDFYEIDPDVEDIARKHFGYLSSAPGPVNMFIGDARISLEKQKDVHYDVLIVDAFGGDSIPTHLVNKDVAMLYKKHLTKGGGIVFHIPSRYFDLKPIIAHIAKDVGGYAAFKQTADEGLTLRTVWAIITWDEQRYLQLISRADWQVLDAYSYRLIRPWSDEYSTILPIINWSQVGNSFQNLVNKYR